MVEAQIICTCPSIWIADLKLDMKKGQSATVPEVQARASKDLELANKNGGVSVTYIERYKELRPPPQERQPIVVKPIPKIIQPPKVEKIKLDEDALAKRLAEKMGSLRDSKTNDLIEKLIGEVISMKKEMNDRPQVVREVVREVGHSKGKIKNDVPMFIPKTIMDEAARDVDLKIKETVSEGNVDEAAEVLRALRKKKKEKV